MASTDDSVIADHSPEEAQDHDRPISRRQGLNLGKLVLEYGIFFVLVLFFAVYNLYQ